MAQNKFVFSEDFLHYHFKDGHPFNQDRMYIAYQLLRSIGALTDDQIVAPRMATDEELLLVHDARYIDFIKRASDSPVTQEEINKYGVGTEDTPIFDNMHEATALIVGGTLTAAEEVMEGRAKYSANLSGGLHHSFRSKASGFCIYNDCSVAIEHIVQNYGKKVLYVDTDAHHGDGVQWSFYDNPNVITLSIHETGRYLFPGTGEVSERGTGRGYGSSFNIPLDAFTEDDSFAQVYIEAMERICEHFKPDVILTQNGADAHMYDPLTHLHCSIDLYETIPKVARRLADKYCEGRWIATGGGGYDWRAVTRAWAMIWLVMNDIDIPDGPLPPNVMKEIQKYYDKPIDLHWRDPAEIFAPIERRSVIDVNNYNAMQRALSVVCP